MPKVGSECQIAAGLILEPALFSTSSTLERVPRYPSRSSSGWKGTPTFCPWPGGAPILPCALVQTFTSSYLTHASASILLPLSHSARSTLVYRPRRARLACPLQRKKRGGFSRNGEIDVCVRSRPDARNSGWLRSECFRSSRSPSIPRQEEGKEKIDRGRHSLSLLPALFAAFLFRLVSRVLLSPRTARAMVNRTSFYTLAFSSDIMRWENTHNSHTRPATCLSQLGDNTTSLDALFRCGWEAYDRCDRDVTWIP